MELMRSYKNGKVITGADAILERFEVALLTSQFEFSPDPQFGSNLLKALDEQNNAATLLMVSTGINRVRRIYFPDLQIKNILISGEQNQLLVNIEIFIASVGVTSTLPLNLKALTGLI